MTATSEAVGIVTEECGREGPTGRLLEVLEVDVQDHGGNRLGRSTTPAGLRRIKARYRRIAVRCVPVRTGRVLEAAAHLAGYTETV